MFRIRDNEATIRQLKFPEHTLELTWRSDSLNILKRYQKMLQLQNS
jgi:hypothetical protein